MSKNYTTPEVPLFRAVRRGTRTTLAFTPQILHDTVQFALRQFIVQRRLRGKIKMEDEFVSLALDVDRVVIRGLTVQAGWRAYPKSQSWQFVQQAVFQTKLTFRISDDVKPSTHRFVNTGKVSNLVVVAPDLNHVNL